MARLTALRLLPTRAPAAALSPVVRALAALGVTPMMLSLVGLAGNIAAGVLVARGALEVGGVVMLLASALDMLDGALARATGTGSRFGALIDSTFDRLSEAVVLFGAMLYALDRDNEEQAALAFAAAVGSFMVSYVRARVEGLGGSMKDGLFTRPERVVLLAAALILGWLRPALWILALATLATALQRLLIGRRVLAEPPSRAP